MYNIATQTYFMTLRIIFLLALSLCLSMPSANAQTDFAPGEIMFTSYNSDAPNGFSFVLLRDVVDGTVIYITDRGWSNTGGFRVDNTTEGTVSFEFTEDAICGSVFVFTDVGGGNDWAATDAYGNPTGIVMIQAGGDTDGMELSTDGDQLLIYQLPVPTSGDQNSFVAMIQMDNSLVGSVNEDWESELPSALPANTIVRFNTEVDNAKYDCTPNTGDAATLQTAITNDNGSGGLKADGSNNWAESNTYISPTPVCTFCCGTNVPPTPTISAPNQAATNQEFTISISGTLAPGEEWELYTAGCGEGTPIQTTTANEFIVTGPGTQQTITYYVRSSESLDCEGFCDFVTVCFVSNLLSLCSNCTANMLQCGDCFLPDPLNNPALDSGCYALKIIFILDESGSIETPVNYSQQVEDGVLSFLNSLNGQDAEVALIEFSDYGRVVNDYTIVNQLYIDNIAGYFNNIPYNGRTYDPGGGTNWHDAMVKADDFTTADLLLFFTDGEPTGFTQSNGFVNYCPGGGASTQPPDIVNPVKYANKLKLEGTHMFMLGVGSGVVEQNLERMSGLEEYEEGINTLGTADYAIGNFTDLAEDLENFILELCRTTIIYKKEVLGPICNGQVDFRFSIINTGTESSATNVVLYDTFPSGYGTIAYNGPQIRLCIGAQCNPPVAPNILEWKPYTVAPGDTVSVIITANVLPTGEYDNTAWITSDNSDGGPAIFDGDELVADLPPTISCPGMVTIDCSESNLPEFTGSPTGTNPDGPPPTFTYSDEIANGSCDGEYTITRTWKATDNCSNTATCIQTIEVVDTTPPMITCPANITVDCGVNTLPGTTGAALAVDACGAVANPIYSDMIVEGECSAEYTINRTWTAQDDCGNTSTCVQVISVVDNTAPMIMCPSGIVIPCETSTLPSFTGQATMVPNSCDGTGVVTYSDQFIIQEQQPLCSILRTWTATDDCGNTATCNQLIRINDIITPTISCPANVTISCMDSTLPASTGTATASDNCAEAPDIIYDDVIQNGACANEYTITRTWKASDDCGNSNTCVQIIVVDDSELPTMMCPPNLTISCTANTLPAATGNASATDNCNGIVVIGYVDVIEESLTCEQEYTIIRTWTATDLCNNSNTCVQTIVVDDSVSPELTCPANITIDCNADTLPENNGLATASDDCTISPEVTYSDAIVAGICPQEYTITRTWIATDDCGNTSTCNQIITLDDSTPPVIGCPADITIDCAESSLPANTGEPTSSDDCGGTPVISFLDVITEGTCPQAYTITRTWKATDDCGNLTTCNQTIVITDEITPDLTCPANVTIECTASTLPGNTGLATASDNCDVQPDITYSDLITESELCPQAYTITRTWMVVDDCGNTSSCVQTINVEDSTSPVLTCPDNITIECTDNTLPGNTGMAAALDNCDVAPMVTYSDVTMASPTCLQEYTITRTWTATDACGNEATCTQTITVDDSTPPTITLCPANVTVECDESTDPSHTGLATASDNCDIAPVVTYSDATVAGACIQEYTITRTWTATDACGNATTCVQAITIDDSLAPTITCPANITIQCLASTLPANTGTATASDNCDGVPEVEYADVTMGIPGTNGYSIARTWTSTDACGNASSCLQNIIVENPLNPILLGLPFDTICSGDVLVFEADDPGFSPITFEWTFGSGSNPMTETGIGPHNVQYTYNGVNGSTGAWVILTMGSPGCADVTDTVSNIHVNVVPEAGISTSGGTPCIFGAKTFQSVAPEIPGYTYNWNFGVGAIPATANTYGPHVIEYSTAGSKTVQLIIHSNEQGISCSDTATITFNVNACPGAITGLVLKDDGAPISGVNLRLFADQNLDGIQDNATIIRNVFTNVSGQYTMAAITPGHYIVVQTQPIGYLSLYDQDLTEDFDSLANWNPNDNILPVTIEPMEIDSNNIFVEVASPGTITGYVFEDFNGNQSPTPIEGIPGVSVDLYLDTNLDGIADPGGWYATTVTNDVGYYEFINVAVGHYVIIEEHPANYTSVRDFDISNDGDLVPNTNQTNDTIPVSTSNGEVDAGNYFIESSACSRLVTTIQDDVPGSLRYMMDCSAAEDTIRFHPLLAGQTLVITEGRIEFSKNLYVLSDLTPRIKIASTVSGAFSILNGIHAGFENIDIISGLSGFPGAAFDNYGSLTLHDVIVTRNELLPITDYLIFNGGSGIMTAKGEVQVESD